MSQWTEEERAKLIEDYKAAEPTAETSMEVVKELAEKLEKTPNGVRMVLTQAGVYVKKTPGTSTAAAGGTTEDKPKRVSKADAIEQLTAAITDAEQEVDSEILNKLTGKAAQYFTGVIRGISAS